MRKVRPFRGESFQLAPLLLRAFDRRPVLDRDRERELIERLPCPDARAELIESNLRLAVRFAAKHRGFGVEFEDLVSEAFEGLCTAADKFDKSRPVRFATYAGYWIRRAVLAALQSSTSLKVSRHMYWASCRELGPDADPALVEMAAQARRARTVEQLRLESDLPGPGGIDDDDRDGGFDAEDALRLLRGLSEREAWILTRRFGIGCEKETLEQIGRGLNLTKERVRQIEYRALAKLRDKFAA